MNEIYAIDPKAPEDLKDIKSMFEQFGLSNGRFIANFPEDWIRMVNEHVQHLQGLDRSRYTRLLELHKDALLSVSLDFRRAKSWVENANEAKESRKGIYRVLGANPNPFGIETLQKFLWEDDSENKSRGAHIPMTCEAYTKAIGPLLQHSTEIHLVDQFFQLRRSNGEMHKGRASVLCNFFIEAEKSNRCEIFKIHFKRESHFSKSFQESQIEDDLNEICDISNLSKLAIEYDLHDEIGHGRYIFSVKGGLHFDHGFEPLRDKTNHVHWLSKAELEPILRRYC